MRRCERSNFLQFSSENNDRLFWCGCRCLSDCLWLFVCYGCDVFVFVFVFVFWVMFVFMQKNGKLEQAFLLFLSLNFPQFFFKCGCKMFNQFCIVFCSLDLSEKMKLEKRKQEKIKQHSPRAAGSVLFWNLRSECNAGNNKVIS